MTPTCNDAHEFTKIILDKCFGILLRAGPFHKEGVYQTLLIEELKKLNIPTIRERVFGMTFKDSEGKDVYIGDNHSLRTDIELPSLKGILELKVTSSKTKQEHIYQVKNYINQRDDMKWGAVINFINKFDKDNTPYVQCDIIYPLNKDIFYKEITEAKFREMNGTGPTIVEIKDPFCGNEDETIVEDIYIPRFWSDTLIRKGYPKLNSTDSKYNDAIRYKDTFPSENEVEE